jgi:transcriptional regulator with XRE-family HTH domain
MAFGKCNELREIREQLGMSQYEAAKLIGKSQTYVSRFERGQGKPSERSAYLSALKAKAATLTERGLRIAKGGFLVLGPRGTPARRASAAVRNDRLDPQFDYTGSLPSGANWTIAGEVRSAPDDEIAVVFDHSSGSVGLVGFHLIDGSVRRGRVIKITKEYAALVSGLLGDLVRGELEVPPAAAVRQDDGLLANDFPETPHVA